MVVGDIKSYNTWTQTPKVFQFTEDYIRTCYLLAPVNTYWSCSMCTDRPSCPPLFFSQSFTRPLCLCLPRCWYIAESSHFPPWLPSSCWHLPCELLADSSHWRASGFFLYLFLTEHPRANLLGSSHRRDNLFKIPQWLPNRLKAEFKSLFSSAHVILPGLGHFIVFLIFPALLSPLLPFWPLF